MGEFNVSTTSTNLITAKITYSESNVNITNNTSDLTVSLIYHKGDSEYATYGSGYFKITVDGQAYEDNHYVNWQYAGDYTALSKTFTISHGSDGTKSATITVNNGYVSGTTGLSATSGSGTATLTTIARASQPSCNSVDFGGTVTVNTNRASDSFTHTITYSMGSHSSSQTSIGAKTTFTVPTSWADACPTSNSATLTVSCVTYNGSTNIGTKSTTATISVPSSWAPSVSIVPSLSNAGDGSQFIASVTSATLTASASGSTGSSINSYAWSGSASGSASTYSTGTKSAGSYTFTCTVTDKRGKTKSASYTVSVVSGVSSISGNSSCDIGSTYSLSITRLKSSFTHTVTFAINSSYTSGARTGKTASDSYTIPTSWAAQIPSSTSTTMTVTCTTYNGSTSLGSTTKSVTLNIPSSWKPAVSISKTLTNGGDSSQVIVSVTTVNLTASATASTGTSISSYSWSGGAVSGTGASKTHSPTSAGSYTYTVTATDARGRTNTATVTATAVSGVSSFSLGATSVNFGGTVSVTISRIKSSFTHKVKYHISNSYTDTLTGQGTSSSKTIPESWAASIPNGSAINLSVTVETMNGTSSLGTASAKTVSMVVPSTWKPSIGSVTATAVSGFGSLYLKGISKVKITASSGAASTGATISKYAFSGSNLNASETTTSTTSNKTSDLLSTAGSQTYTVTITDSRSRTGTKTTSITVTDYSPPTMSLTVRRANQDGTANDRGEYGLCVVTGTYSAVTGNKWSITAKYRVAGSTGSYTTITGISDQTGTINWTSGTFACSIDSAYEIVVRLTDTVGKYSEVKTSLSTGMVIADFYKDDLMSIFSTASQSIKNTLDSSADSVLYVSPDSTFLEGKIYIPQRGQYDGITNGWAPLQSAVVFQRQLTSSDNLNDATATGFYQIGASTPANAPTSTMTWCRLEVRYLASNWIEQIITSSATVYFRRYIGTPTSWSSWQQWQPNGIANQFAGTSWIKGRDGAAFKRGLTNVANGSFAALASMDTYLGSWEIGVLKGDSSTTRENLYFSYATDANYSANSNTTKTVYINTSGQVIDGGGKRLVNTDDISGLATTTTVNAKVAKAGDTVTGNLSVPKVHITSTADASLSGDGGLVIGSTSGDNVTIDGNEILARNNGAGSALYINTEGDGTTYIGKSSATSITKDGYITGKSIRAVANSRTLTIGAQNSNFYHVYGDDTAKPIALNMPIAMVGTSSVGTDSYPTGNVYISKGSGIYCKGTKSTDKMIQFIDNTSDAYGNGIAIGGGGQTIIGGGESATTAKGQAGNAGAETMWVCNDGNIDFYANVQSGWSSAKHAYFDTNGDWRGVRYYYGSYINLSGSASASAVGSYTWNGLAAFDNSNWLRSMNAENCRSYLGTNITSIWSGTFNKDSSAVTLTGAANYGFVIFQGDVSSGGSRITLTIPTGTVGTSAVPFQIADDANWFAINLTKSGSNWSMAYKNGNSTGRILYVYGKR